MVIEERVDYSLDLTMEGIFQYTLGHFSPEKTIWSDDFPPDTLHAASCAPFSPSSFFSDLPTALPSDPVLILGVVEGVPSMANFQSTVDFESIRVQNPLVSGDVGEVTLPKIGTHGFIDLSGSGSADAALQGAGVSSPVGTIVDLEDPPLDHSFPRHQELENI